MYFPVLSVLAVTATSAAAFVTNPRNGNVRSTDMAPLNLYGEPRKVQIIPSVLPADFGKLGADCEKLQEAGVDRIQFDVMDGKCRTLFLIIRTCVIV